MKTKEVLVSRGVRFADQDWFAFVKIAKQESKRTKSIVTPSDVVRHAGKLYLESLSS